MAHTPECEDARGSDWWPESAPTELDVTTLPAAGALSHPLRIPGQYPWLGIWGEFGGARISISATESYQLRSGSAMPYPGRGFDIYLSADTGMWGKAQFARFRTREAAMAWAGTNGFSRSGTGSPLGPFPAASALADADPNPTTTRVGSNLLVWNGATWDRGHGGHSDNDTVIPQANGVLQTTGFVYAYDAVGNQWVRVRAFAYSGDAQAGPAGAGNFMQEVGAFPWVYNDRTTNVDRFRQPDSFQILSTSASAASIAATGLLLGPTTLTQDGILETASIYTRTGTPNGAVIVAEVVRGANTLRFGTSGALGAANDLAYPIIGGASQVRKVHLLSGDAVQLRIITAAGAAAAVDAQMSFKRQRFAF